MPGGVFLIHNVYAVPEFTDSANITSKRQCSRFLFHH